MALISLTCGVQLTRKRTNTRKTKKQNKKLKQSKRKSNAADAKNPPSHRSRNLLLLIFLAIIIFSAYVLSINQNSPQQQTEGNTTDNTLKAAILDGLYDKEPNLTLIEDMVQHLSNAGYSVDVYKGTNVTINLLRNIGGYKIVIMRVHSSIHTDNFLYVFSGEKYTESKYVDEQLAGAVRKAYTFDENEPPYFALNSVFIGKLKPNGLNGTTLMMMGCNGTTSNYVIQRFFEEGVQAYISWDGYVDLTRSDEATLRLVKAMCLEGLTPEAAVEKVNREIGPDPDYDTQLTCKLP